MSSRCPTQTSVRSRHGLHEHHPTSKVDGAREEQVEKLLNGLIFELVVMKWSTTQVCMHSGQSPTLRP